MPKQNESSDLPPPPNYETPLGGPPGDDDIPDDFKYDRILSEQC